MFWSTTVTTITRKRALPYFLDSESGTDASPGHMPGPSCRGGWKVKIQDLQLLQVEVVIGPHEGSLK